MIKTIEKTINWVIILLAFLLPLFFLPITAEFFLFNKLALLVFTTGLLLILWAVKAVIQKEVGFQKTSLDRPLLLFALAYILATIFASPSKIEALINPLGTASILVLTLLYFIITNNFQKKDSGYLVHASILSAVILALVAIYQFIGLGETLTSVAWLKNKLFTPAGSPLVLISFLIVNLLLVATLFLRRFNRREWWLSSWYLLGSILIALGLIFSLYQVWPPGKEALFALLPYRESWAIAIEAFKQNPFFGVGPGNYLSAFNRFRTISFNNQGFWYLRFASASSFPLEVLTTGGLLGLVTYLFLVLKVIKLVLQARKNEKVVKDNDHPMLIIGLLASLGLPWLIPNNFLLLFSAFLFLSLSSLALESKERISLSSGILVRTTLGLTLVIVATIFYFTGRGYLADFYLRKSLNTLVQNQGLPTYNYQIKAISLNPFHPGYRRAYSQTNFALANSLAGQVNLSDQDRANVSRLVQQAIFEAKIATTLNPTDSTNWENLAQLYRNLINFAQGADQWAIASYRQAIATDPVNPITRLNLGGLYYNLGQYDQAIRRFENAIGLKPDYANGYYNLAAAYREKAMYPEAYQAMQLALSLVSADSADYQKAREELEELARKLPAEEANPTAKSTSKPEEALTEPQPLPSPAISPPIELPQESGPGITPPPEATPTPTPQP